jgi:hypothetical protein
MNNVDFQTPDWVCNIMVDLVNGTPETILEPTPGAGNLVRSIKKRFPDSTIYAPEQFEEFEKRNVDYIIANPPFTPMLVGYKLLEQFFEMSNNIIILMPWLALINSQKRTRSYVEQGLKDIIHLPRKAFDGSRVQTCILVFQKGYLGDIIFKDALCSFTPQLVNVIDDVSLNESSLDDWI